MKKILSIPMVILRFVLMAKRSNYSFIDKIKIFHILFSVSVKKRLLKNKKQITQKVFNFKVTAYDYGTLNSLFVEIFLRNIYIFDTKNSSPNIIDCGANIGMALFYFKKKFPDCSIIAFEPNPHAFLLLKKNVDQNKLTNVQLFNTALSNKSGETSFFIDENKGTLQGSFNEKRSGENKTIVKTQKLSDLMNSKVFDLIKIDIEGAEVEVINDLVSRGKIQQSKRYIIEYHHRINGEKSKLSHFIKQFEEANFEYKIKADYGDLPYYQDILLDLYKD